MIIDEPARSFFSDRKVLQQIDHLHEAARAFGDDLATRTLKGLETEISNLAQKYAPSWEYQSSFDEVPRYIGLGWSGAGNKWKSSLRVEFAWDRKYEVGKMPTSPWIGVRPPGPATMSTRIDRTISNLFTSPQRDDPGYVIYETVDGWPDPQELPNYRYYRWLDLYPLIEHDGQGVIQPLVKKIGQIAAALA